MGDPYRSLYSVIPARVRDDPELRPNAKLLYGELSALTASEGYCWAYNAYLAEHLGLSTKTVEALIKQLRDRGHIQTEVVRDPESNAVVSRKIWICGPPGCSIPPPLKNEGRSPQKWGDPPLKIEGENNKILNITSKDSPQSPPEGDKPAKGSRKRSSAKEAPDWKPDRFAKFWDSYPRGESKQAAIRAWDKLKPDDALLKQMAIGLKRHLDSELWQAGFGIPYAATWLNSRRWADEPKAPRPGRATQVQSGGLIEEEGVYLLE